MDKKLKLVNIVQVMLIPCQQRAFNLWEFDPAQHRTLSRLFDTMYEDAWKVLFKGAEAPASAIEDRGFSAQHHARAISCFYLGRSPRVLIRTPYAARLLERDRPVEG